jgi:hypothetical protein
VGATLGWYFWHPSPALVQRWLDQPADNHGVILKGPGSSAGNSLDFSSKQVDPANQPYLEIYHSPAMGQRADWTFETTRLTDRMQTHVNVASGNLMLQADDLRVTGTGLDLAVGRA